MSSALRWGAWATHIIHEVAHTTEGENEEVNLLDQKPLSWLVVRTEVPAQTGSCHNPICSPSWTVRVQGLVPICSLLEKV